MKKNRMGMIAGREVALVRAKGFTLMETMVAIVVLSIGLFATASLQITAVDANSSANRYTDAITIAQGRIEELMSLEYNQSFTDPELIGDEQMAAGHEPFTDKNGNGVWDLDEPYTDSNGNGIWDAAHADPNPPSGYTISWSVLDNRPVNNAKHIRVYVTLNNNKKTEMLACVKSRD